MKVDNLTLTQSLGKGAYGEVLLTQIDKKEGFYATKKLDRAFSEKEENIKRLANEINVLKQVIHPNIVSLIDLKRTKNHIYIVMEYCNGGSLTQCLRKYMATFKRPFTEQIVQYLMKQIINGLEALHSRNILHRDLKLDNILVCFNSEQDKTDLNMMKCTVKITDFGFATILKEDLAHTVIGTPVYMPPDMVEAMNRKQKIQSYAQKADIWSLGVLCYEMLVGTIPFNGKSLADLSNKVRRGIYQLPMTLSQQAVFFIQSMLLENPDKRLFCRELLKQDFLNKNVSHFQKINVKLIPGLIEQRNGYLFIYIGTTNQIKKPEENNQMIQPKPQQEIKPHFQTNNNNNIKSPIPNQNPIQQKPNQEIKPNVQPNINNNNAIKNPIQQKPNQEIKPTIQPNINNNAIKNPNLNPIQPKPLTKQTYYQENRVNPLQGKKNLPFNQNLYNSAMPAFHTGK